MLCWLYLVPLPHQRWLAFYQTQSQGLKHYGHIVLGLDACSRRLVMHLYSVTNGSDEERQSMRYDTWVDFLCRQLREVSNGDMMASSGSIMKPIKKRLKIMIQAYQSIGALHCRAVGSSSNDDLSSEISSSAPYANTPALSQGEEVVFLHFSVWWHVISWRHAP